MLASITGLAHSIWPTIVGASIGLLALATLFFGIKQSGKNEQKMKDQEKAIENDQALDKRIDDATDAANRERDIARADPDGVRVKRPRDKYDRG